MDTFLRLRRKFKFHKVKLTYRSLARMSMYILGTFILISVAWSKFAPSSSRGHYLILAAKNYKIVETELSETLKNDPENADLWRLLVDLRAHAEEAPGKFSIDDLNPLDPTSATGEKQEFLFSREEFLNFLEYAVSPAPELLRMRYRILTDKTTEIIEYHNRSLPELEEIALIFKDDDKLKEAIEVSHIILREDKDNAVAKKTVLECLTRLRNFSEIKKLLDNPGWRPYANHDDLYLYYLEEGNYGKMFYHLILGEYKSYSWKALVACAVAGLGWTLFLVHLGSAWFWKRKEQILLPVTLFLGMCSAAFCLGVVVIQDYHLKHTGFDGKSVIYNLAYSVLGIGLREELCKLLFFLPVLYFIKNIKEDYKILCFCSLAGLGFAIEENISYFMNYGETAVMARFLTANFAHTFMTGFTCFYLVKAIQKGGHAWDDFTSTFIKMVGIHGIYDFLLIDPVMREKGMNFFAMMIYVYVALLYLRLLMTTAPPAHQFVSLTRVFTISLCFTIGITFMMISSEAGIKLAIKATASGIVVSAIYAYMFYREFDENIG